MGKPREVPPQDFSACAMDEARSPVLIEHDIRDYPVLLRTHGSETQRLEFLSEEVPVALVYNGISHAVMLATPLDLESFALGFSLSEQVIGHPRELYELEVIEQPAGIEIQMRIAEARFARLKGQRRSLAGRTGCGLCGTESLAHALRQPPMVKAGQRIEDAALSRALQRIADAQRLYRRTGAVHAAAWCDTDGEVRLVMEDVGRHNALDKLIGEAITRREKLDAGFVFITSRASYEMVCKTAAVGIATLASVSAPTALAARLAKACGMLLIGRVTDDSHCIYAQPEC